MDNDRLTLQNDRNFRNIVANSLKRFVESTWTRENRKYLRVPTFHFQPQMGMYGGNCKISSDLHTDHHTGIILWSVWVSVN